ncbi:MAG: hypothetical protein GY729_01785, partial [Desulfobacteraceae bacterium]|nr:hypothetical protein [Desulfobacteraceae bacterium]
MDNIIAAFVVITIVIELGIFIKIRKILNAMGDSPPLSSVFLGLTELLGYAYAKSKTSYGKSLKKWVVSGYILFGIFL